MGDTPHRSATPAADELGRRQFMRKAAVAGAIVWTVPTIVSIAPAGAADRHSAPPKPPVEPIGGVSKSPADGTKDAAQLPFTGDNELIEFGIGATAVAAGAAMLMLSAESAEAVGASEAFRAEQ